MGGGVGGRGDEDRDPLGCQEPQGQPRQKASLQAHTAVNPQPPDPQTQRPARFFGPLSLKYLG